MLVFLDPVELASSQAIIWGVRMPSKENYPGKCVEDRVQILGLDGFVVVPEGFVAALDLLLDVSGQNLTTEEAAETEAFVRSKARPDVLWKVWTELS